LHATRDALGAPPSEAAIRARDLAERVRAADDALVAGSVERARALYLEALERSPRQPEIASRIADIDARDPGRAEAALALVVESLATGEATASGLALGELRMRVGDVAGAVAAFERSGETETVPVVASKAFELAARAVGDVEAASRQLDLAIAHGPRGTTARWMRVRTRLAMGRLEEALADAEHLEALAEGNQAKCSVWMRAGRMWTEAQLAGHAGPLFERALLYAPEDVDAIAGLGAALVRSGGVPRGAALLVQALESASGPRTAAIALELGRVFAERLDDLPAAVAYVSSIPGDAREAPLARGLEGRWRAELGDVVGAGLAFARLRDLAVSRAMTDERALVDLLVEAAHLERNARADLAAAQRHLAAALRLRPHDDALKREYREVGALLAGALPRAASIVPPEIAVSIATPSIATPSIATPELSEAQRSVRVEELTRLLQANPRDEAVGEELAQHLEALDRGPELLALLSARMEDATPAHRAELLPRVRATLQRVAERATTAGRSDDAALFRDALTMFAF
jgi:tetratricopeptide (TPR) repeat protein